MERDDRFRRRGLALATMLLAAVLGLEAGQELPTAARLRAGATVPLAPPLVVGGGEVVLDATVGPDGRVTAVDPVRATVPFTELLAAAVRSWQFDAPTNLAGVDRQPSTGHVLVLAVFRPPQVYPAPTLGEPTRYVGEPAPELPAPGSLTMPLSYPPRLVGGASVLIEIALTSAGVARDHKVLSPPSGFDGAALDTVRLWRFDIPREPTGAPELYAYAVVSFREPITQ